MAEKPRFKLSVKNRETEQYKNIAAIWLNTAQSGRKYLSFTLDADVAKIVLQDGTEITRDSLKGGGMFGAYVTDNYGSVVDAPVRRSDYNAGQQLPRLAQDDNDDLPF